jgi:hypothetical protein
VLTKATKSATEATAATDPRRSVPSIAILFFLLLALSRTGITLAYRSLRCPRENLATCATKLHTRRPAVPHGQTTGDSTKTRQIGNVIRATSKSPISAETNSEFRS